jgi:hypothetical protein
METPTSRKLLFPSSHKKIFENGIESAKRFYGKII